MTRINVVPPAELCNKHLLAEYRELPRVFGLAKPVDDAPSAYVLGKGHVRFFYDKLGYLAKRQRQIIDDDNSVLITLQFKCTTVFRSSLTSLQRQNRRLGICRAWNHLQSFFLC